MRKDVLLFGILLALAFGAGCRAKSTASTASPTAAPWHLTLTTTPAAPSSLGDTQFRLEVTDAQGQPVDGVTATMDIAMATMDMGTTHMVLKPQGGGVYTGTGQFTMAGPWNCTVTVQQGTRSQVQVFHFTAS